MNRWRILGRWKRLLTILNQSPTPIVFLEFDDDGRIKPSAYYNRMVDVMGELMKFTVLTRVQIPYLVDRCSKRQETVEDLSKRINQIG